MVAQAGNRCSWVVKTEKLRVRDQLYSKVELTQDLNETLSRKNKTPPVVKKK